MPSWPLLVAGARSQQPSCGACSAPTGRGTQGALLQYSPLYGGGCRWGCRCCLMGALRVESWARPATFRSCHLAAGDAVLALPVKCVLSEVDEVAAEEGGRSGDGPTLLGFDGWTARCHRPCAPSAWSLGASIRCWPRPLCCWPGVVVPLVATRGLVLHYLTTSLLLEQSEYLLVLLAYGSRRRAYRWVAGMGACCTARHGTMPARLRQPTRLVYPAPPAVWPYCWCRVVHVLHRISHCHTARIRSCTLPAMPRW